MMDSTSVHKYNENVSKSLHSLKFIEFLVKTHGWIVKQNSDEYKIS